MAGTCQNVYYLDTRAVVVYSISYILGKHGYTWVGDKPRIPAFFSNHFYYILRQILDKFDKEFDEISLNMEDEAMLHNPGKALENMGNGIMENHKESTTKAANLSTSAGSSQKMQQSPHKFMQSYIIAFIYFASVLAIKVQQHHRSVAHTKQHESSSNLNSTVQGQFLSSYSVKNDGDVECGCSLSKHVTEMSLNEPNSHAPSEGGLINDGQFCDKHVNNGEVDAEVIVNSKIESSDGSSSVRSCNSSSSLSSPVSEEWAAGEDGLLGALSSGAEGSIGVSMGVGVGVIPTGVSACMMNADCKASGGNNSTKSSGYCSGAEANTNLGSTSTGSGKNDSSVQSSSQSMYDNRKHTCVDKTMTTLFIANKTSSFINQYMATYILQNSGWEPWLTCKPQQPLQSSGRGRTWSGGTQSSTVTSPVLSVGSSRSLDMSNHGPVLSSSHPPGRSLGLVGGGIAGAMGGFSFFRRCTTQSSTGSDPVGSVTLTTEDDNNTAGTLQNSHNDTSTTEGEDGGSLVSRNSNTSPCPNSPSVATEDSAFGGGTGGVLSSWPQISAVGGVIGASVLLALICRAKTM